MGGGGGGDPTLGGWGGGVGGLGTGTLIYIYIYTYICRIFMYTLSPSVKVTVPSQISFPFSASCASELCIFSLGEANKKPLALSPSNPQTSNIAYICKLGGAGTLLKYGARHGVAPNGYSYVP